MGDNYYSIIPIPVRYANISDKAKLLYAELTSLINGKGVCEVKYKSLEKIFRLTFFEVNTLIIELTEHDFINHNGDDENLSIELLVL